MNKYTFAVFLTAFLMSITVQAQDGFHRLYSVANPDSVAMVTDAICTSSGEYYVLTQDRVDEDGYSMGLVRLDNKGGELYTRRIFLADSTRIQEVYEVDRLSGGLVIAAASIADDKSGAVIAVDQDNGIPSWSYHYGADAEQDIQLEALPNNTFILGSTNTSQTNTFSLSMIDDKGEAIWTNSYQGAGLSQVVLTEVYYSAVDSNIYLTGHNNDRKSYFLASVDTLGNAIWSKNYTVPSEFNIYPNGLVHLADSTLFVSATASNNSGNINNYLARHDSLGNQEWTVLHEGLDATSAGLEFIQGQLCVGLHTYADATDPEAANHPAVVRVDTTGVVLGGTLFSRASLANNTGRSVATLAMNQMDGASIVSTSADGLMSLSPDLASTNATFTTPCSQDFTVSYAGIFVGQEDISWSLAEGITLDTMETDVSSLDLIFPTTSLETEEWCPNEAIMDTLDATPSNVTPDAIISYEWSTGDTDSLIVAMEEGEFMVTVTIDDEHCYKLCDTVTISRLPLPQVSIVPNGDLCNINPVILLASATGNPPFEYTWSTGSTESTIEITDFGTYSVSITDACQESTSASLDIVQKELMFEISSEANGECEDFEVELRPVSNIPLDDVNWQWTLPDGSTSMDTVISSSAGGEYSLQASYCDNNITQTVNVTLPVTSQLSWPKVFFPNGQEELNRTFGPTNSCNLAISNYELKVFNRWGQEVFSSTNIADEWDGNYNGGEGSTAVYVWYANYSIGDEPFTDKGDVTLIRQ